MTNEEAKEHLKDILDDVPNDKCIDWIEALDMAIKALEQQPCEDCISRTEVIDIINFEDKWLFDAKSHNADTKIAFSGLKSRVKDLPSVTPSDKALKEAYDKGFEYGVKEWFASKTKPYEEIIKRIEQVRDNDKNAGEYPYNRCIEIIREVMG